MVAADLTTMTAPAKLRRFAGSLALSAFVLYAQAAAARPEYPLEIKDTLQLDCAPTCLMCHTTMDGGGDNLNNYGTQNGIGIVNGIPAFYAVDGPASMRNTDMDKEGVMDRDEIIANTDPGSIEPVGICSDAVYGCGAQVAPGRTAPTSAWGLVAALGVAALLLRQLRRA